MIIVYNETKISWGLDRVDETTVRFSKSKERQTADGVMRKTINVLTYNHLFDDIKKVKSLLTETRMKDKPVEPVVLSNKLTSITFNKKEFKPFISERTSNNKHVLLGSLFLQGRKVVNVRSHYSFLLDFFMLNAEFSFIASINNERAMLHVDLLDQKTNIVTEYAFFIVDGEMKVTTEERPATAAEKSSSYHIRVFRPARPTHAILVHEKDLEVLKNTVDVTRHNVVVYRDIEKEAETLATSRYKAVTLFVDSTYRGESKVQRDRFKKNYEKISPKFLTVFKLHKDGDISKIKY